MVDSISGGTPASPRPLDTRAPETRPLEARAPLANAQGKPGSEPLAAGRLEARSLARDMAQSPPVDTARVEALRTSLQGGTYRLDIERLADAMIRSERPAPR